MNFNVPLSLAVGFKGGNTFARDRIDETPDDTDCGYSRAAAYLGTAAREGMLFAAHSQYTLDPGGPGVEAWAKNADSRPALIAPRRKRPLGVVVDCTAISGDDGVCNQFC